MSGLVRLYLKELREHRLLLGGTVGAIACLYAYVLVGVEGEASIFLLASFPISITTAALTFGLISSFWSEWKAATHYLLLGDVVVAGLRNMWIFSGNGQGEFTLRADLGGRFQFSLAAADYDADGDLDIYACNYSPEASTDLSRFGRPVPFHNATNGGPNVCISERHGQ